MSKYHRRKYQVIKEWLVAITIKKLKSYKHMFGVKKAIQSINTLSRAAIQHCDVFEKAVCEMKYNIMSFGLLQCISNLCVCVQLATGSKPLCVKQLIITSVIAIIYTICYAIDSLSL